MHAQTCTHTNTHTHTCTPAHTCGGATVRELTTSSFWVIGRPYIHIYVRVYVYPFVYTICLYAYVPSACTCMGVWHTHKHKHIHTQARTGRGTQASPCQHAHEAAPFVCVLYCVRWNAFTVRWAPPATSSHKGKAPSKSCVCVSVCVMLCVNASSEAQRVCVRAWAHLWFRILTKTHHQGMFLLLLLLIPILLSHMQTYTQIQIHTVTYVLPQIFRNFIYIYMYVCMYVYSETHTHTYIHIHHAHARARSSPQNTPAHSVCQNVCHLAVALHHFSPHGRRYVHHWKSPQQADHAHAQHTTHNTQHTTHNTQYITHASTQIFIYMHTSTYTYTYTHTHFSFGECTCGFCPPWMSLQNTHVSMCVCVYVCMRVCVYVCMCLSGEGICSRRPRGASWRGPAGCWKVAMHLVWTYFTHFGPFFHFSCIWCCMGTPWIGRECVCKCVCV